jgi:hypothetical protein
MRNPFQPLLILYLSLMFLGGLLIRTYERTMPGELTVYDGVWLAVETQTTIGYGEMPPIFYMTQIVCCGVACVGVFANTVVTTSLLRITKLTVREIGLVDAVRKHTDSKREMVAIVLMQRWWRLVAARKHKASLRFILLLSLYEQADRFRTRIRLRASERSRELKELLHITRDALDRKMHETARSLQHLKPLRDNLARFCTKQVAFVTKMLLFKRKIQELRLLFREERQTRRMLRSRRSSAFSKKQQKLASESAYRRMLERRAGPRSVSEFSALRLI